MMSSSELPRLSKPTVVGLYGIPGCGKSFLVDHLKAELGDEHFAYYDGSSVLSSMVPGGLNAFKQMDDQQKYSARERAICHISDECSSSGRVGVVAGHLLFWDEGIAPKFAWTAADAKTYTHILFLDVACDVVAKRRLADTARVRPAASLEHLETWAKAEFNQLRALCLENTILFTTTSPSKVEALLNDIQRHTEAYNLSRAEEYLDCVVRRGLSALTSDAIFVLDGDRTLTPDDTGALFVQLMLAGQTRYLATDPLKEIFMSSFGYSHAAFRQVAFMYEALDNGMFEEYCVQVASSVVIHPEFVGMLEQASQQGVSAVIITCGLQAIWEHIIERAGLSLSVKVVGGGRVADGFVVTAALKAALVARLRDVHHKYVCAFGDSVLDLPMLKEADRSVVVVGEVGKRSVSMDAALAGAIENNGLLACQVSLPLSAPRRLDSVRLPSTSIDSDRFIDSIVSPATFAPSAVAQLLMTSMRDATVNGPLLRKAHENVGYYLAISILSERIGLEKYTIPHVQGHQTTGNRFHNEDRTTIVALMRGGEPMALGVNKAMPLAMFVHVKVPGDLKDMYIHDQRTIILVDSVVNTGKSIVEFVMRIREIDGSVRIVVVAGVVQAKAFSRTALAQMLMADHNIDIVALRKSENKFTGRGTTDTGNRLFNTTRIE